MVELIDRSHMLLNTRLWTALQTMTYQTAVPIHQWTSRVDILSKTFGHVVSYVMGSSLDWSIRDVRSELLYMVKDTICESCLLIPASFRWRCCKRSICQRCVCVVMMLTTINLHLKCPCCNIRGKIQSAVTVEPISSKIADILIARLHQSSADYQPTAIR
ncbi:hypothetical protein GNI_138590 [Gregarina niphandrodes]|uniref:Uncharacterized protein n=1 Tax=Gregarina niphandrodes TaxID=110365 RepID=A0A023B0L6_GRENI|nr:hypothetical protein GNI_138590 [Gregarina niphandrodes]EZG45424.1 hypothetical protein GNI_138590 [Gregarina niphandrodes]|eukprot:XP_011132500.1 hypothetical protein GNI_138590 [Gregarina niphandrodes]